MMEFAEKIAMEHQLRDIRIDTHHDNIPMRTFLAKLGYHACGTIYLNNGDKRIAYQKHFEKKNALAVRFIMSMRILASLFSG